MQRIKTALKKITPAEWLLMGVLAAEMIYLLYCNLFHIADNIESDIAKMMVHTIEMAEHGSLLLPEWIYTTTAEWDSVALPALIPYRMTGDIFLSYGMVNCINIFLFAMIVNRLLKQNDTKRFYRLLALALLFGLYDMEDIWYTADMLFTAGAQYIYKVMLPLLFLTVLTTGREERRKPLTIALSVLCFAMALITAMSSGVYVFACGLFPVIACYVLSGFRTWMKYEKGAKGAKGVSDSLVRVILSDPYQALITMVTLATGAAGYLLCRAWHVSPGSSTPMNIRSIEEILQRPLRTLQTLLQVWSLIPEHMDSIMPVQGAGMIAKVILIVPVLFLGIYGCRNLLRGQSLRTCLISIFAWNYLILFLTYATPRYHLIGAVPLVICAVLELQALAERGASRRTKTRIAAVTAVLLSLIGWASIDYSERVHFHKFDVWTDVTAALRERLDAMDIQTVIWLNGREMVEIMRLYDRTPDRLYTNMVVPEEGEMYAFNWNTYYAADDRIGYEDRNIIVATAESFQRLPEYARMAYGLTDVMLSVHAGGYINEEFRLYLSDTCPMDGSFGLPRGDAAIDLACSSGYQTQGTINAKGELETTDEGVVYESVFFFQNERESAVLNLEYGLERESSSGDTYVEIADRDGNVAQKIQLIPGEERIEMVIAGPTAYRIRVIHDGTGLLRVGKLRMTRQ